MVNEIAAQADKVRRAYALTNSVNPEYEREFDILSDMRADEMAAQFRRSRGLLDPNAKTPYDRTPRVTVSQARKLG